MYMNLMLHGMPVSVEIRTADVVHYEAIEEIEFTYHDTGEQKILDYSRITKVD